jgi:hypothetical protein
MPLILPVDGNAAILNRLQAGPKGDGRVHTVHLASLRRAHSGKGMKIQTADHQFLHQVSENA